MTGQHDCDSEVTVAGVAVVGRTPPLSLRCGGRLPEPRRNTRSSSHGSYKQCVSFFSQPATHSDGRSGTDTVDVYLGPAGCAGGIFADGFASGDLTAWSASTP